MHKPWKPIIRAENTFLAILLLATTLLLVHQGWLWRIDQFIYDIQLQYWERPASENITIVAIDENSLKKLGSWPWPPEYFTRLLNSLALDNPRAVAFYFPLPLSDTLSGKANSTLLTALQSTNNVYLPVVLGNYSEVADAAELADFLSLYSIAGSGHVDITQDKDGIVRSSNTFKGTTYRVWKNINSIIAGNIDPAHSTSKIMASIPSVNNSPYQAVLYDRLLIPFAGPPGHFHTIPFYKLLSGGTYPGEFNNKVVLIGTTAPSIGRSYPTPDDGFLNPMSLVEINANILDSELSNITVRPAVIGWVMAFSGIFALLPFLVYPFFSPRGNVVITVILIFLALILCLILVHYFLIWLPPSAALIALILGYMLWSSRRLENAVQYLDKELAQLSLGKTFSDTGDITYLDSIFHYLERIFPISGWIVTDKDNQTLYSGGTPPDPGGKDYTPGHWSDDGVDYWTSLHYKGNEAKIGVRWKNSRNSFTAEKRYLDRLLKHHSQLPDRIDKANHELIQNLIQQVQDAIINLRNTHKFLDDSLSHMADGIIVTGDTGKVLLANSRAVAYLRESDTGDLAGEDIIQLLDHLEFEGNKDIGKLLSDSILQGTPVSIHASNNAGQDLLLQISPAITDSIDSGNIIFNLSDISHLKSVERARNETLSFVSHDLRSPLVSVLALLELAKNRDSSEELSILHARIEDYTKLTINLAEQFIQLARVESDAMIRFDIIDLVSTAINAHEQVWVQAQSKNIHMVRNLDLVHGWVRGDSGLLERAITNLLNNAIKYSPDGSSITMNIFRKDSHLWCCIEDEGYGIPQHELSSLFERFRRAHLNSGVDQQGIGLGLALVKATAERHGGYVDVNSEEGTGSRFCLVLPATDLNA